MIIGISLKSLLRRRGRTALALAGLAVSSALLLDMTMLANGLTYSFSELADARGYGMRITPRGTLPFDSEAGLGGATAMRRAMEQIDGVESVAPVLGAQLYLGSGEEAGTPLFTTGIDPDAQMIFNLADGATPRSGEAVISRPLAEAEGIAIGDDLALAAELDMTLGRPRSIRTVRVSGIGDFIYDAAGQRSLALPLADVQELTGRPDEVSLFAIASADAIGEEAIAARIEELFPDVSAYSTPELTESMDQRLGYFRQLSTILGTISLLVAILLAGTILTIGIRERFHEFATLRAIGIPAARLQLAIIAEGLILTAIGCVLGAPLAIWMAGYLDGILLGFPGVPARVSFFVFQPLQAAAALGALLAAGTIAGLLPGRMVLRAPLGLALREEAD